MKNRFPASPRARAAFIVALITALGLGAAAAEPLRAMPRADDPARAASAPEEFAWDLFIVTNWPALQGRRGVPDPRLPFGRQAQAVWETWKASTEIFLAGGSAPPGWDAPDPIAPGGAKTGLRLSDGVMLQSSGDPSFVTGGLRDVHGAPIYSEVRMNRIAFDHVVGNELFNVEGQLAYLAKNQNLAMPFGSMEVKASWRVLDPVRDRAIIPRYFLARGVLVKDDGRKVPVTLGLTGMNLMTKVRDHWFWTSFEQVDNPQQTYDTDFPSVKLAVRVDARMQSVNAVRQRRLAGTPWSHYRSNGAQIEFVGADGRPTYLSNTQQETRILKTSSCIGCHAYSAIGRVQGRPTRLFPLRTAHEDGTGTGYAGIPNPQELRNYMTLDYMWSFIEAAPKDAANNPRFLMVNGEPPPRR